MPANPKKFSSETTLISMARPSDWSPERRNTFPLDRGSQVTLCTFPIGFRRDEAPIRIFQRPPPPYDGQPYDGRFSSDGRWLVISHMKQAGPKSTLCLWSRRQDPSLHHRRMEHAVWPATNELFFVSMGNRLMAAHTATQPNSASTPSSLYSNSICQTLLNQLRRNPDAKQL